MNSSFGIFAPCCVEEPLMLKGSAMFLQPDGGRVAVSTGFRVIKDFRGLYYEDGEGEGKSYSGPEKCRKVSFSHMGSGRSRRNRST